ncbi:diacylglycerol kinase [Amylibacter sp. SFDW26]|uniref:diacylglycerol kinase n=1 Tax=Amylibacter sp. SFDW26 TaxID=2652722 RepID=UPI0012625333|nr:diacylglycerol kinase [Amylibacter sp. SFDW26]KAB7613478.1 diacylglycerol kinase [Amylibacter sp. SFDW26]
MGYIKREAARIVARAVNTWDGLKITWKEEASFPQWCIANIVSASLTFAIDMTAVEQALIIGFGLLVLVAELFNTGIEAAIDRVSSDIHPLSKKAKDAGCAAVALTAVTTGVIWVIIALPKVI